MTSLLIVFLGMSVPILAAAPFYIADRRREAAGRTAGAELQAGITEAPRIWPQTEDKAAEKAEDSAVDAVCEIPEARTAEEANALAETVRIEQDRVAQP